MKERIPGEILQKLSGFGRLHLLDTCGSTNDYALSLPGPIEPAVVVAREQTRAQGRFRRAWYCDPDSLCFSVLLPAGPEPGRLPSTLTQLVGLAVCLGIESLSGLKPLIRWPNDVLLNEQKIAGILCERKGDAVAVGIGINVNQTGFPEDIPEPGSLRQLSGRNWDKYELLAAVLEHLFRLLREAAAGHDSSHLEALKQRSSVLHRRVEVRTLLRRHLGTVVDLDREGRLVLRTSDGKVIVLNSGQVRRLR